MMLQLMLTKTTLEDPSFPHLSGFIWELMISYSLHTQKPFLSWKKVLLHLSCKSFLSISFSLIFSIYLLLSGPSFLQMVICVYHSHKVLLETFSWKLKRFLHIFSLTKKSLNITGSKVEVFSLARLFFRRQKTLHICMHILVHIFIHSTVHVKTVDDRCYNRILEQIF